MPGDHLVLLTVGQVDEAPETVVLIPCINTVLVLVDLLPHQTAWSEPHIRGSRFADRATEHRHIEVVHVCFHGALKMFDVNVMLHRVDDDLKTSMFSLPGNLLFGA